MTIYLGENIKGLRQQKGITQETLSEFLGVTFQSVSRWERGEGYPDITLLPAIAAFFDVTVDELLGVGKTRNEQKISEYIELYDSMKLKDISLIFTEYKKAVKEFPGDFRILVRYMELLQEEGIFNHSSLEWIKCGNYKKPSAEIEKIYNNIQRHCTDDSIRIRSKKVMISHLMWKYDCICDDEGKYGAFKEYLHKAQEIKESLPSLEDSREICAIHSDSDTYYSNRRKALEELIFLLHNELFGYCLNYSAEKRIAQFECLQGLLSLIYPDGDYGKNCINRLYNYGHLGHLYHQIGDDKKALGYLKTAALYSKELDSVPDITEKAKRFYNYGTAHREMSLPQFMKTVMTEHYPLSDEFKAKTEFKDIVALLC